MSAALDGAFGEELHLVAMKAGASVNLPRVIDGARPAFTVKAAFLMPSAAKFPPARGSFADDDGHKVDVSMPRASIDRRLLEWGPQQGDRLVRTATGAEYEIAKMLPDGVARTILVLTAKKR